MLPKQLVCSSLLLPVGCGSDGLLEVSEALQGGLITPGEMGEKKEFDVSHNLQGWEMFPSVISLKLKLRLLRFT